MDSELSASNRRIFSVTDLTRNIKGLLEEAYPFVWVSGEISNFRKPASGHFYFTLKDPGAQISAVMFRGQNRSLKFRPEDGLAVIAMGRLNVYEPRGVYQIIIEYLEPQGIGIIQLAFEQLKAKLAKEGLFDEKRKRSLPFIPRKIAVVTSPTGAVIRDILHVINRRFPNVQLEIAPVRVQGEGAAEEIVEALKLINERNDSDVIVVARGGGSLEDLQAFNSEIVARAIFSSVTPVVSAVGHETDFTIADFTADVRAPTPSSAAELIVPVRTDLLRQLADLRAALGRGMFHRLQLLKQRVAQLSGRLVHPRRQIADCRLRLDETLSRLLRGFSGKLQETRRSLAVIQERLVRCGPQSMVQQLHVLVEQYRKSLCSAIHFHLESNKSALGANVARLDALSPLAVLERGYSVTRILPDCAIVKDVQQVRVGQDVEVTVSKGQMVCRVERKIEDGQTDI